MKNKLVATILSLSSAGASAQLDLSFNLFAPVKNSPLVLRVVPGQSVKPVYVAPVKANAIPVSPLLVPGAPGFAEKKVLVSPKLLALPVIKVEKAGTAKVFFNPNDKTPVAAVRPLEAVKEPTLQADNPQVAALIDISEPEYKMIQGLLLAEFQKKYDLAFGVFAELLDDARFKMQAQFSYAEVAQKLGLHNEYRQKMLPIVRQDDDKSFRRKAVESMVVNAVSIRPADVLTLDPHIFEMKIETGGRDAFQIKRAKQNLAEGDLSTADSALQRIIPASDYYPEAVLLKANSSYRRGDVNTAISTIEKAAPRFEQMLKKNDKIRNLLYLTLARMQFQKGNYKSSYANYLKIDKSNAVWLQSQTEQALSQIMAGDNIGAAGNMFSLHTDYFKKAYAPETYIIRTVGYLNLCQYGDAASALVDLTRRYGKTHEQLQSFKTQNKDQNAYYGLVKEWFSNTDQSEVKGVPRSYIVELARSPQFLAIQNQINNFEDELQRFTAVSSAIPAREQSIRKTMAGLRAEIAGNRAKKINDIQTDYAEKRLASLDLELQIAATVPKKIEKMRSLAANRMAPEKEKFRTEAAAVLQKKFSEGLASLNALLEQKDVLAYEIYSGAGEHLRYQMAGGKANDRNPAEALTPEEQKSYKWKFRGEVWEDEIGHYRSSLTNVCPDQIAKNSEGK